jgi:LuxR family transcriptional regulator, maltose regulon positive regulatory protein
LQTANPLIRTKLHMPFTRPGIVSRLRLQEQVGKGLHGLLTMITAPAGFGKTTLVASVVAAVEMPVAWLSLDRDDNQAGRFLSYLVAALQAADHMIGSEAAQFLATSEQALPETILTSLINDLDTTHQEMILVLDDYQFINSQAVHDEAAFLLEHCPNTLHVVIATRSDPPLPLARLRARGQMVELRAADLRFTEPEAAQFLNDVMELRLDSGSVAALEQRTEGWIAGLQMAAIAMQSHHSMRDREDIPGFIEGFSGTNRYILDFLLEEVLRREPEEVQAFLHKTAILTRLAGPLCDAVTGASGGQEMLERLERRNLFLVPLDDDRRWYRYHHLFADLLQARLDQIYPGLAPQLHARAAAWYEQNGSVLEAIQHASMAPDDETVERLIEQNYLQMMNQGENSSIRYWMGKLSKEYVYRRPWLCLYEAFSRSWFGQLEEANLLLNEAEKRIRSDVTTPDTQAMLGYHAYVQSRITAMQGDTHRAIELCHTARGYIPADNVGMQIETGITLGYEYFLYGDFFNANKTLNEMIRLCYTVGAINNPVAGYAILARMQVHQGRLHEAYELLQKATQLIQEAGGQYLGAIGLVEVGIAALLYEWNEVEAALVRVKKGLDLLPYWGKADDLCLAYTTLSRIHLSQGNRAYAAAAIEKAAQVIQTCGVFSEARCAVETTQVNMWLGQGDRLAADRWVVALEERFDTHDPFRFENELPHITQARILLAQNKPNEAIRLLSYLEESARASGRQGRLVKILILKALALKVLGEPTQMKIALMKSLELAEPGGYVRIFLDEGRPMQTLLAEGLTSTSPGPMRDYAVHLLSQFDAELPVAAATQESASPAGSPSSSSGGTPSTGSGGGLVEPLSPRELEVLYLMALGKTNQEIARQLIVAPGTVKAHTASIYRKLDVANRTEAAARARQLGILP